MKLRMLSTSAALLGVILSGLVIGAQEVRAAQTNGTDTQAAAKSDGYTTAIFVSNRSGKDNDDKVAALEDYITSRITDQGMTVISRETALNAVGKLDPGAKENTLDAELAEGTSAVRLAQTLGADYLLQVSLTGFDSKKRSVDAYGVKASNDERTVRVTYKILDGTTGGSLVADTVKATKMIQQSGASGEDHSDVLNELLDEASQKVAASMKARLKRRPLAETTAQGLVNVTIRTEAADLAIPDVRVAEDNTVTVTESKYKIVPLSVNVEVNGISVGSAPGMVQVRPGLSKLRVTREGFKPWERTVNFSNGQSLTVTLAMSDEGYARWRDSTAFIDELKSGAKLTEAEVKVLEGKAKMLQQSGIKVDTKEGIKIDNRSLFGN